MKFKDKPPTDCIEAAIINKCEWEVNEPIQGNVKPNAVNKLDRIIYNIQKHNFNLLNEESNFVCIELKVIDVCRIWF